MKKTMKKALIVTTVVFALCGTAHSQTTQMNSPVGIGTSTAYGDLHIHESNYVEPMPGIEPRDRLEAYPGDYFTTFRMTNTTTMSGETDGFEIKQTNREVSIRQLERGNLYLYGHNKVGLMIDTLGRIGLGDTIYAGKKLNIGGNTRIAGKLDVNGKVTGTYGEFSQSVMIYGAVRIGNGFECSATGEVKAKSLKITLDGWSDFVFDDGYRLPTLAELEQYVKANRHLPDIPSAAEVEQEGVDLGQMNAKLLQKVEELTLYVIDLQKQIDELKNNNN